MKTLSILLLLFYISNECHSQYAQGTIRVVKKDSARKSDAAESYTSRDTIPEIIIPAAFTGSNTPLKTKYYRYGLSRWEGRHNNRLRFQHGDKSLMRYLYSKNNVPEYRISYEAYKDSIRTIPSPRYWSTKIKHDKRVITKYNKLKVKFILTYDGNVLQPEIYQVISCSPQKQKEILQIVKDFPKWKPINRTTYVILRISIPEYILIVDKKEKK